MENINIKVILDEVFGKSCNTSNNIACDTCKYKEDIIKLATEDGFELDWLINRWDSIIENKDILKPIIAVFPKYAKDMIINIVKANSHLPAIFIHFVYWVCYS